MGLTHALTLTYPRELIGGAIRNSAKGESHARFFQHIDLRSSGSTYHPVQFDRWGPQPPPNMVECPWSKSVATAAVTTATVCTILNTMIIIQIIRFIFFPKSLQLPSKDVQLSYRIKYTLLGTALCSFLYSSINATMNGLDCFHDDVTIPCQVFSFNAVYVGVQVRICTVHTLNSPHAGPSCTHPPPCATSRWFP